MPIMKLTESPDAITPNHAMIIRWEAEILSHALFPKLGMPSTRERSGLLTSCPAGSIRTGHVDTDLVPAAGEGIQIG